MNTPRSTRSTVFGVAAWILAIFLLIGTGTSATAQTQDADDPSPHSEATLVSEVTSMTPGEPFTVALRLEMDEGWHSYWINPGDSGQPTSIDWSLPDGFEAGSIQWPFPHRIEAGSLTSYGYSDEVLLLTTITPPDTLTPGRTVTLSGRAEWLICEKICLQAHGNIETSISVETEPSEDPRWASAIASTRSKLPMSHEGWTVEAARTSGSYTLALKSPEGHRPELEGAYFFPSEKSVLDHAAPQPVAQQEDTYFIALQQSSYAQEPAERLEGVLVAPEGESWSGEEQRRAMRVDVPVDSSVSMIAEGSVPLAEQAGASSGGGALALPWALLFAFVGGLLLNLMPCVFPVLSVKILGFAKQAGERNRTIRRHGLLFGVGVLVSMWVLAGALLALRAAGSQIGWGFQLQSPLFVALMAMLFFVIGLNLLGAFEVGTSLMNWGGRMQEAAPEEGDTGAFLTGVLATVVATPCTAPFMGAALGVALTLSATGALLIFTALGVGMATPYVALSMAPALLDRLPEPGAWMETLKQAFSFPMFATCIWLVWVFGRQTGNAGVALLLVGLLLLGIAAWILHRWSAPRLSRSMAFATRSLVLFTVAGAIAAGVIGAGYERPAATSTERDDTEARWQPYSAETIEELRAEGRPVFVDFTAAWCLTCQVNKRRVLSSQTVKDAFADKEVALVRADWTNRDPEITKALESHGRSGVPVYVLYAGDGSEPELLPEVLTEDLVLEALDDLPGGSS